MSQTLLEKHESLVAEMANIYLDNMARELGKKYKDNKHQVNASLTDAQHTELKKKYNISSNEFSKLYSEFHKMKPSTHLNQVMSAFTASGGSVDVEPVYDEDRQRLDVSVNFFIGDKTLEKIEGLSPMEDLHLRINAMLQVDTVLSGSDPDMAPTF